MIRILLITIFLCGILFTCGCSQNKTDLDSIIGNLAFNNVDSFLKAYLDMAKFITYETVDDQYFEDFYYDADFIIEHNKLTFCKLYPELKNKSKGYLIDFYEDYCQ